MFIKQIALPKEQLTTVHENATLAEALEIMNHSGFRSIPVVDKDKQIFRGIIYKMHIYKHLAENGQMDIPVTYFLKHSTKFLNIHDSFFKVFFTIKELPFIAIVDENQKFYGIVTHNHLLKILEKGWNIDQGGYVLTIKAPALRGTLTKITKIISKYTNILNCITMDSENPEDDHIIITLPKDISNTTQKRILNTLKRHHFKVLKVEELAL